MKEEQKIRVLIAEDEAHIRLLLRKIMEQMGAVVVAEATNGQEAVDLFQQHRPHIVLMDVVMPVLDGKEAIRRIMAMERCAFVIVLSALSSMDVVKECLALGAANFIRKDNPVDQIKRYIKESWQEFQKMGCPYA
ncbi:MAG: response regulator [Thermodesulfobacteriota bacterium]